MIFSFNLLYSISIVTLLIVITVLLTIFMPKPKSYFDAKLCPELNHLVSYFTDIQSELSEFIKQYDDSNTDDSNTVVLYNKYEGKSKLQSSKLSKKFSNIPISWLVLRSIPNVVRVGIVSIKKKYKAPEVMGNHLNSNKFLRVLFPINISGGKKSGIWVNGETKLFEEGKIIIYDNSHINSIYNKHKRKETVLLAIDLIRPSHISHGISDTKVQDIFPVINKSETKKN